MKTLAIDFETANGQRVSACSVGLAWIEKDAIIRKEHRLIRPQEMRFNDYNIFLHKIRPGDVVNEPDFPTVFSEFLNDISGGLVLAHQAEFEVSVIRETLRQYHRPCPEFRYLCTRMISEAVWPHCGGSSLEMVTDYLGIPFRHHNAEEDAVACAKVALAAAQAVGASTVEELARKISVKAGRVTVDSVIPCTFSRRTTQITNYGVEENGTANRGVENSLYFDVEGSTGNIYEIAAWRVGSHFHMTCTCEAGKNSRFCKHRAALLNGIFEHVVSNNEDDVGKLAGMIRDTDAARLFATVQSLEDLPFEDGRLKQAKRELGFELGRPNQRNGNGSIRGRQHH